MLQLLKTKKKPLLQGAGILLACSVVVYLVTYADIFSVEYRSDAADAASIASTTDPKPPAPMLDVAAYDQKVWELANNGVSFASSTATTTKKYIWPAKAPYPNGGALLPFYRIVAYYGNFYSTQMGVLGQYPSDVMLQKLAAAAAQWAAVDPTTPVMPAIDYIAVTAQASPGADGMYRLRMPDSQIDHALDLAQQAHGIVVLDVQVGKSTLEAELPLLEKYLKMSQVNLAIDPEFSIKVNSRPGLIIGTFSAQDVDYAANYLAGLVRENSLPPKILVVHRFTEDMVTGYRAITPLPEVQIVMDMDGWGFPAKKINTYNSVVASEPVQFTGFKLFYKADLQPPSTRMLTPAEILSLTPMPIFIQYQ